MLCINASPNLSGRTTFPPTVNLIMAVSILVRRQLEQDLDSHLSPRSTQDLHCEADQSGFPQVVGHIIPDGFRNHEGATLQLLGCRVLYLFLSIKDQMRGVNRRAGLDLSG